MSSTRIPIGSMVEVPAGQVHVREDGPADAPALVLVHGFTCSMHWFDLVTPLLSETHRVVRLDLLGHGCSTRDTPHVDADAQAAMALSVLDSLGIGEFVAVGHSFGTDVAIGLAERSARATGVVVLGQAPDYSAATLPPGSRLLGLPGAAVAAHFVASRLASPRAGGPGFARGFRPDHAFARGGQAVTDLRATDPRMFTAVSVERARSLAARPLDVRLRDLALPALVVLGGKDRMYPVAPTRERYAAVPGLRVEVIDDSGHSPMVEHPQQVADLLLDFLTTQEQERTP